MIEFVFPKTIRFKKEKDSFDWWEVCFHTPFVLYFKNNDNMENKINFKLSFSTSIRFFKEEFYYQLSFKLLGFGFAFARQWGY